MDAHPNDAECWACLADAYVSDYLNRWNEAADPTRAPSLLDKAEDAVQKAGDQPVAHYAMGMIHRAKGEHDQAPLEFGKAQIGDQNCFRYNAQYANQLINVGRAADASPYISYAVTFGTTDLSLGVFHWILGRMFFFQAPPDYDNAIIWFCKSVHDSNTKRDNLWFNRLYLVSAYALRGRLEDAAGELGRFRYRFPDFKSDTLYCYEQKIVNPNLNLFDFHMGLYEAKFLSTPPLP